MRASLGTCTALMVFEFMKRLPSLHIGLECLRVNPLLTLLEVIHLGHDYLRF